MVCARQSSLALSYTEGGGQAILVARATSVTPGGTPVTTHLQARAGAVAMRAVRAEATMRGNYSSRVLESSNRAANGE